MATTTNCVPVKDILYCDVCTFPPEYCEFAGTLNRCKAWLQEHHENLFLSLYSNEASASPGSETTTPTTSAPLSKVEKKMNAEAALKKKTNVIIKHEKRKGKKMVTIVQHLDVFDIDLKKTSKMFAQKFATGCSINKNAEGKDELVVQGDIVDEVAAFILASFPNISEDKIQSQ